MIRKIWFISCFIVLFFVPLYAEPVSGTTTEPIKQELAKDLQNPIADLISVPFASTFEYNLGEDKKGYRYTLKVEPVVPVSLNNDWLFILRPILPFIHQGNVISGTSQEGLGDLTLETFFSPKNIKEGGLIWGAGPLLLLPTATNSYLGNQKYGAGPVACALEQSGPWSAGILVNNISSFTGNARRKDVNVTFLEPFVGYAFKNGFSISFYSESTYDWKAADRSWTIPLIGSISQVLPLWGQYVSVGLGGSYYPQTTSGGPKWDVRLSVTFLFPGKSSKVG